MNVLIKYGDSDFIKNFIRYLYEEKEYKHTPLSEIDLIEIQNSIFIDCCDNYISKLNDIDDVFLCFYSLLGQQNCDRLASGTKLRRQNRYITNLLTAMKDFVESNKHEFLTYIYLSKSSRLGDKNRLQFMQILWGSWKGCRKFLSTLDDSDPFYQEVKEYFEERFKRYR